MRFQGLKRLTLAGLLAVLGAGCEYTKIYEVAVPRDTTEDVSPPTTVPSAEGDAIDDEIIVPERKEDEVAASPEAPEVEAEGEDAGAAPMTPEAPRAEEDEETPPIAADLPVLRDDVEAPSDGDVSGMILGRAVPPRDSSSDDHLMLRGRMVPQEDPSDDPPLMLRGTM